MTGVTHTLTPWQIEQLDAIERLPAGGFLALRPVVGGGSSTVNLLASLRVPCRSAMLIIHPTERAYYRALYERLRQERLVPTVVFYDGTTVEYGHVVPQTSPLHVVSGALLARPEGAETLAAFAPDFIIACERVLQGSRSVRVLHYLAQHEARCVAWTLDDVARKTVNR